MHGSEVANRMLVLHCEDTEDSYVRVAAKELCGVKAIKMIKVQSVESRKHTLIQDV